MIKRIEDIPGWFRPETAAALETLIKEHNVSQVIEIGSYLGKSTCFFLMHVLETIAIDPFVMWAEGRENGDAMRDGGEDFYDKFKANVEEMRNNNGHKLAALRVCRRTSREAWLNNPSLEADLIYIDASHDYYSVKQDISMWGLRAKKVICGDDYDENWPGVVQAVDEAYPDRVVVGNFWYKVI